VYSVEFSGVLAQRTFLQHIQNSPRLCSFISLFQNPRVLRRCVELADAKTRRSIKGEHIDDAQLLSEAFKAFASHFSPDDGEEAEENNELTRDDAWILSVESEEGLEALRREWEGQKRPKNDVDGELPDGGECTGCGSARSIRLRTSCV